MTTTKTIKTIFYNLYQVTLSMIAKRGEFNEV